MMNASQILKWQDELNKREGFQEVRVCGCRGPQNGDPVCPCRMKYVTIENGRYVERIDLGPVPTRTA